MPTHRGSFRIFRLLGIDVYLHWSWFLVAVLRLKFVHYSEYSSPVWYVIEYLSLFLIVLMHEFGHALACRQVGGQANQIVLWPLGGVAYVSPPQRPGAMLWSIAAGPLVNVALLPVFFTLWFCGRSLGWEDSFHDFYTFLFTLLIIDVGLLIFNLLPIYPLDGGKILWSVLWFPFGRANSLLFATIIGFIGVAGLGLLALFSMMTDTASGIWLVAIAGFMGLNCWNSLRYALALSKLEKSPRRPEFACPVCHEAPPAGEFWRCGRCRKAFDTFLTQAMCPHCGAQYNVTACLFCHNLRPMPEWRVFQQSPVTTGPIKEEGRDQSRPSPENS